MSLVAITTQTLNTFTAMKCTPNQLKITVGFSVLNVCVEHTKCALVVMKRMITSSVNYVFKTFFQDMNRY